MLVANVRRLRDKEFPFLNRLFENDEKETLSLRDVDTLNVELVDTGLLSQKPNVDGCGSDFLEYTRYFAILPSTYEHAFFDESIVEFETAGKWSYYDCDSEEWDAPTLGEQLMNLSGKPKFIVRCIRKELEGGFKRRYWTIYKMKGFDEFSYVKQQLDVAYDQILKEYKLLYV